LKTQPVTIATACIDTLFCLVRIRDAMACRGLVMPRVISWLYAPYQILLLSSGVWWSLLLDIRCLWRHNMT